MHAALGTVTIDGLGFHALGGDDGSLTLTASGGAVVTLRPWSLADHLGALEAAVLADDDGLRFDPDAFARAVLHACAAADADAPALAPAALWWAAGADPPAAPAAPDADGWLPLARGRARLRAWSWADRCRALDASLSPETGEFRVGAYLRAMVRATVVELDGGGDPLARTGADAPRLLAAVVAQNVPQGPLEDALAAASDATGRALAADTLRLCRALGWTPSQVWSLPAVEVERLLALLDRVAAPAPRRPPPPAAPRGLAAYPDAVIVRVEDD